MFTADIFRLADLCIEAGCFPGLEDRRYALLLVFFDAARAEIHRADVSFLLPHPCRVWLVKGTVIELLGDSASLPGSLADGVRPPFLG